MCRPLVPRPLLRTVLPLLALAVPLGCASHGDIRFGPSPTEVAVGLEGQPTWARALLSVHPIERSGEVYFLPLRLRLESHAPERLRLDLESLLLVDASLEAFGPAFVARLGAEGEDINDLGVAPSGEAIFAISFPFRSDRGPGAADLRGINLRWGVSTPSEQVLYSTSFDRLVLVPYY